MLKTDVVDGVVNNIFPLHLIMEAPVDGSSSWVEGFIIVNELVQTFGHTLGRYKINAWKEQAKKLNVEERRYYRFTQWKIKRYKTPKKLSK